MIVTITAVLGSLLLGGLLVIIVLHVLFLKRHSKYLKNVPGPKPNPVFGNMLSFAVPSYEFFDVITKFINQHGPTMRIFTGPLSHVVIISDEKLMEYVLSSHQLIEKAEQYDFFHKWLGTGLLVSKGPKWKTRRRLLTPAFHFSILENFVEVFETVGDTFIEKLASHVDEVSFNVYPLVSLYTLDVICEAAMGTSVNAQNNGNSRYVQCVKEMCAIITDRNFSPLDVRLFPLTPNYYKEKRALKVLHAHTDDVIDRRIKKMKSSPQEFEKVAETGMKTRLAFLDLLLRTTTENGERLSRADIREEVDTFMFEGHDTTSSAISFTLYCLANHPEAQQKALEEQVELFGQEKNVKPSIAKLQSMKYLELVIKEALRLYPPVPFFARKVQQEFEWENSIYPRGLQLVLFPYMSQRNPKYFPEPTNFRPERFLELDGTNPYRYTPFSAGPRNCIGQKFAMLELKSTISKVLRNFELHPANPNPEFKLAPEVILVSKNGINISIKRRN